MPKVSAPLRPSATVAAEQPPPPFLADGFPNPKAMGFWEYQEQLKAHQWSEHNGYIYRLQEEGGKHGLLLDKFFEPITPEGLKEKYGGGFYRLHLKRGPTAVYVEHYGIEGPPKVSPVAAASPSPQLEHQVQLLNSLVTDLIQQRDNAQRDGKQFNVAEAVNSALAGALDLQKMGYQAAQEATKNLVAPRGESAMEKLLVPALAKVLERALEPPRAAAADDPLSKVEPVLLLMEKLEERRPSGGRTDPWATFFSQLAPHIPGIAQNLLGAAQLYHQASIARMHGAVPAAGTPPGSPRGVTMPTPRVTPPDAPPGESTTVDTPQPTSTTVDASSTLEAPPAASSTLEAPPAEAPGDPHAMAKHTLVAMLYAGRDGEDAAEVLDEVDPNFAAHLAQVLHTNPAAIATDPILARAALLPKAQSFAEQYVAYFAAPPEKEQPEASSLKPQA